MSIVYAAVARGTTSTGLLPPPGRPGSEAGSQPLILAEFQSPERSPRSLEVKQYLANVPTQYPTRQTQSTERYLYHILVEVHSLGGQQMPLLYVCVAEPALDKSLAFQFLEALQSAFSSNSDWLSQAQRAAWGDRPLQYAFESTLTDHVQRWNSGEGSSRGPPSRLDRMKQQVSEVKEVMAQNVEKVLQRGDRLDDLVDRSDDLQTSASEFRTTSRRVERHFCMRNLKCNLILIALAVLVIGVVVLVILFETHVIGPGANPSPKPTTSPTSVN